MINIATVNTNRYNKMGSSCSCDDCDQLSCHSVMKMGGMLIHFMHILISLVIVCCSPGNTFVIFKTEANENIEYYDCILEDDVPYCRRPGSPIRIQSNSDANFCHNNGQLWSFERLRDTDGSISRTLTSSRVSLEKAEEYNRYLNGYLNNGSLCVCREQTFGNNCQYRLINDGKYSEFRTTREWQNLQKESNRLKMQIYYRPLCYLTVQCNYGLLCLDWRDICDGRQQCMHGTDEEACDLLEFNECEDNEYRCPNGMCIPEIYFLDGGMVLDIRLKLNHRLFVIMFRRVRLYGSFG